MLTPIPMHVDDINWNTWKSTETAVLCFIRRKRVNEPGELMLIRKKRGLGAGKINGPGGRIDPGETAWQAAIRETEEEIGLTPRDLREAGRLSFQFVDGYGLQCTVFDSWSFSGTPRETDEAVPMWCPADRIPFDEMWADDELWMPHMLDRAVFRGYFVFDGDLMVSHRLEIAT